VSEPLSIAAQINVPAALFEQWLKQPLPDERQVLDALADMLDSSDCNPEALFLCQYLPEQQVLLFFLSDGRTLQDAVPQLDMFRRLASLAGEEAKGYLAAGRYPYGGMDEEGVWRVGKGRLGKVRGLPSTAMAELDPLLAKLIGWMPEQRRHQKALYFRKLVLHFNKRGNAFVRRAAPDNRLWFGDDYTTDGQHVYVLRSSCGLLAVQRVEGADPYHFSRVAGLIWGDGTHLFYQERRIAKLQGRVRVVGNAVVVADQAYLADRDGNDLYYDQVDPGRFKCLCRYGGYYSDGSRVWHDMQPLPESPDTFEILGWGIARGHKAVYLHGRVCAGVDPASLMDLGSNFFQDREQLWFHDSTGSDFIALARCAPGTAKVDGPWCRDDTRVWYNQHLLAGADPSSFQPVNYSYSYAADVHHVWCQEHPEHDPEVIAVVRAAWTRLASAGG
jgi:hypothetical protein